MSFLLPLLGGVLSGLFGGGRVQRKKKSVSKGRKSGKRRKCGGGVRGKGGKSTTIIQDSKKRVVRIPKNIQKAILY